MDRLQEIQSSVDAMARDVATNSLRDAMQPFRDLLVSTSLQDTPFPATRMSITQALDQMRDVVLKRLAEAVWEDELNKLVESARGKR